MLKRYEKQNSAVLAQRAAIDRIHGGKPCVPATPKTNALAHRRIQRSVGQHYQQATKESF